MEQCTKHPLTFSTAQNRIITASLTLLCGATLVVGIALCLKGVLNGLNYLLNIVGPVIVAFFLSLLTRPWYARLKAWFKGNEVLAVLAFSLSFLVPLVLLTWFFGAFLIEQGSNLAHALPKILEGLRQALTKAFPDASDVVANILPNLTDVLGQDGALSWSKLMEMTSKGVHMGGAVFSAGSAAMLWLLTFFYWIIFVMKEPLTGEGFARRLPFISEKGRIAMARYFRNFSEIMVSYFRGQIIDVSIQGVLYGTAFQILGLPNGFIIGFVLGILNLVPYLGVMSGLCVALPVAFFHAGFAYTCVIFGVFCVIQTFDGYVMQPYIQGDRMKLSAWQIVFALLFWTQIGGFLGLLLAIPLTAFVKASWDEWRDSTERFVHMPEENPQPMVPNKKEKRHAR
jgi:predicted PurR-regulated permease PerM